MHTDSRLVAFLRRKWIYFVVAAMPLLSGCYNDSNHLRRMLGLDS